MYRHFATVTVAITALIAFFASGENHKVIAAAASASQHRAPSPPKHRLESSAEPSPDDDWGNDHGAAFGQPMIDASVNGSSWLPNPFGLKHDRRRNTGEEQTLFDDANGDEEPAAEQPAGPSAAQIAAAAAASRLRSGAHGND